MDRRAGRKPEEYTRVVEIVGPAGAGKTTLVDALGQASPDIRAIVSLRKMSYLARFAATALAATPMRVRRHGTCRLGWREMRLMVHLGALHHLVPPSSDGRPVVVFDQGPVYMLTRLYGSGVEGIDDPRVRRWWDAIITRWASTVDKVIRLDAPDPVLRQRIRAREKWHVTKDQSEHDACEFLRRFRRASDVVLERVGCVKSPRLVEFDTSQLGLNEIVEALLGDLLGDGRAARPPRWRE